MKETFKDECPIPSQCVSASYYSHDTLNRSQNIKFVKIEQKQKSIEKSDRGTLSVTVI